MSDGKWDELMEREARKSRAGKVVSLFPDQDDELPADMTDYRAASRPANKGLVRLLVILGKQEFRVGGSPYRFFQYVHLGADAELGFEADGQVMRFHFTGMTPKTLTVRGRNLLPICDTIQQHRIHWIRQADRDFTPEEAVDDSGQPMAIIRSIEINSTSMIAKME